MKNNVPSAAIVSISPTLRKNNNITNASKNFPERGK